MSPSKSLSVVPTRVRPYQGRAKIARPSPAGTMQAADPVERSARSSSRWVPRLGLIRGTSSSSTTSSGRSRSAQTPVALTTLSAATSIRSPDSASTKATPLARPLLRDQLGHLGPVQHHRAEPLGLAEDGEDEADVVGLAVVEEVGVVGVARLERGDHLEQLLAVDRPVAVGRPVELLVLLLRGAHLATAAADPRRRHHVVHVEADPDFAVAAVLAERGDEERRRVDQVGRELDHQLALEQRLANQAEVEVLEVAEAAVDHLRGAARGADRVVAALEQRDRVAAGGGVERDPGAGDPAADHDDLEALARRSPRSRLGARDHRRAPSDAITVGTPSPGRPAAAAAALSPGAAPEVEEADEALALAEPDRAPPRLAAQDRGRPPVAGEAAGVGGEQDDVGGDRGRVQVLLVLDRVALEHGGDDDQRRRAVELGGALGAGGLLQRGERLRPEDAEAPGRGQVVVGRPPRQLEQRLELLAIERLGARTPCGCGGCGSPSRRPSAHRISRLPAEAATEEEDAAEGQAAGADPDPDRGQRMRAPGARSSLRTRQRRSFRFGALAVVGVTGIGGPGVAAGGVSGADPPDAARSRPEPPLLEGERALGGVGASGVGDDGAGEVSSGLVGAGFGFGARGGTGEIGNDLPATAGRTWAVTQTGVWLLEEEYLKWPSESWRASR